jgi:hypothetical protein
MIHGIDHNCKNLEPFAALGRNEGEEGTYGKQIFAAD